jgi:hypothetical protein
MVTFNPFEDDSPYELPKLKRSCPTPQCLCGRFAKYVGVTHYYNGNFDCETLTVECKHCGTVDIELV